MSEKKKLLSTKEAAEYCGFKLSYFRKLMDAENDSSVQAYGQVVFLKSEESRRILHRRAHLLAG